MSKLKLCLLFGGQSPEHDVSLRSASYILEHIDSSRYSVYPVGITRDGHWFYLPLSTEELLPKLRDGSWALLSNRQSALLSPARGQGLILFSSGGSSIVGIDCVFPALHGVNGEDGAVQGLCELAGIPYVGPDLSASAVCMDKALSKLVAKEAGVPVTPCLSVMASAWRADESAIIRLAEQAFSYPMFIKPSSTGSSVGISKAKSEEELRAALALAARYGDKLLIERAVNGREIEVALLGNEDPLVSICGEIVPGAEFYTYDDKYVTSGATLRIPADLAPEQADTIRRYAKTIYRAIGCRGLSRVDFFLDRDTGDILFNEINSIPGFTDISMYPKLMEASGVSGGELVSRLISSAMEVS